MYEIPGSEGAPTTVGKTPEAPQPAAAPADPKVEGADLTPNAERAVAALSSPVSETGVPVPVAETVPQKVAENVPAPAGDLTPTPQEIPVPTVEAPKKGFFSSLFGGGKDKNPKPPQSPEVQGGE